MSADWQCSNCGGTGRVPLDGPDDPMGDLGGDYKVCPACQGSGVGRE